MSFMHPIRLASAVVIALSLGACATFVEPPDQRADLPSVIDEVQLPVAGHAASAPQSAAMAASAAGSAPLASSNAASAPADSASAVAAAMAAAASEPGGAVAAAPVDPLRPEVPVDLQSTVATIDLWERLRRGFRMPDIDNDLVRSGEQYYATRPDYVQRMTERGSRYLFHIVEEVERRGMPTELALLPFIESAFNPQAISSAKASGMWQFMPATGKHYELRQNIFRDDRRDVLASTRAALDYLGKLHDMFNDWHLALAAYNWGEGNVQRAIARNKRSGKPTDYLSLRMPRETAYYVPKLQAVKNLVLTPSAFSITLPELANHPYFLSVPIERDIDVAVAIQLANISREEFYTLNPQMNKPVILAAGTPQLLLPYDNASLFVRNLAAHRGPFATWTAWVAPRTLKPADAAKQVGMSEEELREVNKIPPRMLVRAGSTLLVPRAETLLKDVSLHVADNAVMALAPEAGRFTHRVSRGDTLYSIARRYRVTVAQVAEWNNISAKAPLSIGRQLVVYASPHASKPQGASKSRKKPGTPKRHRSAPPRKKR